MYVSVLNDPVGRPLSRCLDGVVEHCLSWCKCIRSVIFGASSKLQRACDAAFSGTSLESQIVLSSWYSFHPELVLKA